MKVNTANLNPGVWFDVPDDPDGARVCIRVLDIAHLEVIREKAVTQQVEYKQVKKRAPFQRFEYESVNEKTRNKMMWDYCIVDWVGFFDEASGDKLACNEDNKYMLMAGSVPFATFIAECLENLETAEAEQAEEQEKNSEPSQSGSSQKNHVATVEIDTD